MVLDPTADPLPEAGQALERGDPERAADLLASYCTQGVAGARHWFLLGTARGMQGDAAGAEQALREALRFDPSSPQILMNLGRAVHEQGRLEEAAKILQEVLAIAPAHGRARTALIDILIRMNRLVEAEANCDVLITSSGDERVVASACVLLARVRKERGDTAAAIRACDRAIQVDRGFAPAYLNKGILLRAVGDDRSALECFETGCRMAPENDRLWYMRGLTAISLRQLEAAAESLQTAFGLNPADVAIGSQLASVYRHLRRLPESVEISRKILAVDPDNARARFYVQAFDEVQGKLVAQRIPPDVAEATYADKDVGRHFEASLKGGLEYRAPEVLEGAVREVCGGHPGSLDILEIGCGTGLCGSRVADLARRLVGTDLSASMLDVAREKDAYTDLYVADLVDVLSDASNDYDLVIAMDVLCYFGDLTDIFSKCRNALRPDGVFAFSVEKPDGDEPWVLHPYGHFVHSLGHIRSVAKQTGFEESFVREMVLRREALEPRVGYVCLYRRGA